MQTLFLNTKDVVVLKRGPRPQNAQVQRLHAWLHQEQKVKEVIPDSVVRPNEKITWLNKIGEELEEWVASQDDVMSHKGMREACAEAVKMKRDIEKDIAYAATKW